MSLVKMPFWPLVIVALFHNFLCFSHSTSEINEHQDDKDSSSHIEQFIKEELDLDKDGLVSKKEMIHRMETSFSQQRRSEVDEMMKDYDINHDKKISWKEFLSTSYQNEALRNSEDLNYDKNKFNMADTDHDGLLDSKEFASFYFPGPSNENMVEWLMDDWLEKVDLNRDGFVTLNEFLASQSGGNPDIRGQRKLREHFTEDYDMDKDGKIDKEELKEWLFPNRASARRETRKMLKYADNDGDGHLSVKEIIENDRTVRHLLHDTNSYKDEL